MPAAVEAKPMSRLLVESQFALHKTQKELGELMGCSRRTMIRYQ